MRERAPKIYDFNESERVSENRDLWHIPNPSVVISIVVRIAFSAYKASHTYTPVS